MGRSGSDIACLDSRNVQVCGPPATINCLTQLFTAVGSPSCFCLVELRKAASCLDIFVILVDIQEFDLGI